MKFINMNILLIKTSSNLYILWNIGSLIIIIIFIQITIGFLLSINYFTISQDIFINSYIIYYNLNYGWILRFFHRNLTSIIFILLFIHITRRLIYKNFININIWIIGIIILIILIIISFLGYSLIWRQISYWARIVITNFIAVIPIIGNKIIYLIWGNRFINNILINRFFSIHFLIAITIIIWSLIHLIILHIKKSSNPLNLNNKIDQINLNPLFIFKDIIIILILIFIFIIINIIIPIKINNPDNFNSILIFKTPNHIEPEWYFLFFYSILRSINRKLLGLILTMISIIIIFFLPVINKIKFINNKFFLIKKIEIFILIIVITLISFIGSKPSKYPYTLIVKFLTITYFLIYKFILIQKLLITKI